MDKRTRTLNKKGKTYVVTFDEYGVIDTIERDGKLLSSTNRDARVILNHPNKVYVGIFAPPGFTWGKA